MKKVKIRLEPFERSLSNFIQKGREALMEKKPIFCYKFRINRHLAAQIEKGKTENPNVRTIPSQFEKEQKVLVFFPANVLAWVPFLDSVPAFEDSNGEEFEIEFSDRDYQELIVKPAADRAAQTEIA